MNRQLFSNAIAMIEPLEDRQLFATTVATPLIGDAGSYIGTARIRTSLKGEVRKTAVALTISKRDKKTDIVTGTIKIGKLGTFNIKGSIRNHHHTLSFAISKTKLGSGIFSGKIIQHHNIVEGRITLNFAKFSTAAVLNIIPNPSSTGTGTGTGTAAVPPPTVITPPTGSTGTGSGITGGGSIFG